MGHVRRAARSPDRRFGQEGGSLAGFVQHHARPCRFNHTWEKAVGAEGCRQTGQVVFRRRENARDDLGGLGAAMVHYAETQKPLNRQERQDDSSANLDGESV